MMWLSLHDHWIKWPGLCCLFWSLSWSALFGSKDPTVSFRRIATLKKWFQKWNLWTKLMPCAFQAKVSALKVCSRLKWKKKSSGVTLRVLPLNPFNLQLKNWQNWRKLSPNDKNHGQWWPRRNSAGQSSHCRKKPKGDVSGYWVDIRSDPPRNRNPAVWIRLESDRPRCVTQLSLLNSHWQTEISFVKLLLWCYKSVLQIYWEEGLFSSFAVNCGKIYEFFAACL